MTTNVRLHVFVSTREQFYRLFLHRLRFGWLWSHFLRDITRVRISTRLAEPGFPCTELVVTWGRTENDGVEQVVHWGSVVVLAGWSFVKYSANYAPVFWLTDSGVPGFYQDGVRRCTSVVRWALFFLFGFQIDYRRFSVREMTYAGPVPHFSIWVATRFAYRLVTRPRYRQIHLTVTVILNLISGQRIRVVRFVGACTFSHIRGTRHRTIFKKLVLVGLGNSFSRLH